MASKAETSEASKMLREAREVRLTAQSVLNRQKYNDLNAAVRQSITASTSPRSAPTYANNYGNTDVTRVDIDQRGFVIHATEREKERGVDIEVVILREAIPEIVAMMLLWLAE